MKKMPTINIRSKISFDELLEAVVQLDASHFNEFMEQAQRLHQRQRKKLSKREQQLIATITKELDGTAQERINNLRKSSKEVITVAECTEMESLIKQSEQLHFQRIMALGELAQLREQPVNEVAQELGFQPFGI